MMNFTHPRPYLIIKLFVYRNFLQVNKFYSLDTSIQLLSNAKLYDLLIETSLVSWYFESLKHATAASFDL